jgi:hypothetical protein
MYRLVGRAGLGMIGGLVTPKADRNCMRPGRMKAMLAVGGVRVDLVIAGAIAVEMMQQWSAVQSMGAVAVGLVWLQVMPMSTAGREVLFEEGQQAMDGRLPQAL